MQALNMRSISNFKCFEVVETDEVNKLNFQNISTTRGQPSATLLIAQKKVQCVRVC